MGTPNLNFVYGDVTNTELLLSLTKDADVICPLACLVGAPLCKADPQRAWAVNYNHVKILAESLKPGQKLLYPTTNSGYGVGPNGYCDETTPLNPISVYGESKAAAEKSVQQAGGTDP